MKNKIKLAIEKLNKEIRYEDTKENPHSYFRIDNGKLLAGVSSISSLAKTKDADGFLAQWKVNEAIDYIRENCKKIPREVPSDEEGDYFYEVEEECLLEAKYAYKDKGKEATDIGTQIHELLENHVNQRILGKQSIFPYTEITKLFVDELINWEKENNVQWIASEMLVGDLKNDIAGRLDGLALVNGKLTIIDFKVANNIPSYYYVQLAGYHSCLKAMGIDTEDRIIMRLPKTPKRKVWVDGKYQTIENKFEIIKPKTDYEFDQECFLHCREMYRWLNQKNLKHGK